MCCGEEKEEEKGWRDALAKFYNGWGRVWIGIT